MSKPFEREKDIRSGKLDAEQPSYSELTSWLQRVPKTWLPALLIHVVELCEANHVFKDGGLERMVSDVVAKCKNPTKYMRSDDTPAGKGAGV